MISRLKGRVRGFALIMTPNQVVMWVCVAVFVVTAFAAVVQLFGWRIIKDPRRDAQLFRIIIAAVAVAAVGAFAYGIKDHAVEPAPTKNSTNECSGNNPPLECYLDKK
jgi:bacteriorhodopsin